MAASPSLDWPRLILADQLIRLIMRSANNQFGLRTVFLGMSAFGLFLLCALIVKQVLGSAVPKELLHQIHKGMPKERVLEILGKPRAIRNGGILKYARTGNVGYVDIHFDQKGNVLGVNDESIFP